MNKLIMNKIKDMEVEGIEYFATANKWLAMSLGYLGFKYYKFTNKHNSEKTIYSFVRTELLNNRIIELNKLRI